MLFNSYTFLLLFLPITLLGYYKIQKKTWQLWFLFFTSCFFYAYWSQAFLFLLLATVILDFYLARAIGRTDSQIKKKRLLFFSLFSNLSVLGFFKYYDFFAGSMNEVWLSFQGWFVNWGIIAASNNLTISATGPIPLLHLILPIGISFYTFQSMSYVIDVYRGVSKAHGGLLEFAGYVTLFPHQISGPLVRHNQIVPQLESHQTYFFNVENFWKGCSFFILGLSKKMLIADRISNAVDMWVGNIHGISHLEAWLAMLGYSIQLYFDFSGYSDMAVGLGLMMNIQFPANFMSPYKSSSITMFWQKWHMTLSSWLKDYLYISLGGNRCGKLKTYRNLLLTMGIGGLWHGANWTFLVWGILHGAALALERFFKDLQWDLVKIRYLKIVITYLFVCFAWVFFRAPDLSVAKIWINKILLSGGSYDWSLQLLAGKYRDQFWSSFFVGVLIIFFAPNTWELSHKPRLSWAFYLGVLFIICFLFMGEESPFLYFQF